MQASASVSRRLGVSLQRQKCRLELQVVRTCTLLVEPAPTAVLPQLIRRLNGSRVRGGSRPAARHRQQTQAEDHPADKYWIRGRRG
jgi:hypothetical protein